MNIYLIVATLFSFPIIVFLIGRLVLKGFHKNLSLTHENPLNIRFGYDANDIKSYWDNLVKVNALNDEYKVLKIDLFFPFFYGGALFISLFILWVILGSPFGIIWIILPIGISVISDWIENLLQLFLMQRYIGDKNTVFDPNIVKIASTATKIKLFFLAISGLVLLVLSYKVLCFATYI